MRQSHIYHEIPMNSNTNQRSSSAIMTYQSYIIDSQKFTPLTQDDVTILVKKLSPQESSTFITVFPDKNGLVSLPHSKFVPQYIQTIVSP